MRRIYDNQISNKEEEKIVHTSVALVTAHGAHIYGLMIRNAFHRYLYFWSVLLSFVLSFLFQLFYMPSLYFTCREYFLNWHCDTSRVHATMQEEEIYNDIDDNRIRYEKHVMFCLLPYHEHTHTQTHPYTFDSIARLLTRSFQFNSYAPPNAFYNKETRVVVGTFFRN